LDEMKEAAGRGSFLISRIGVPTKTTRCGRCVNQRRAVHAVDGNAGLLRVVGCASLRPVFDRAAATTERCLTKTYGKKRHAEA
jgi:hypothetical protein